MNEYLATAPCDIYELHLFRLVARLGSFTKAGEKAGLTQSAITRQVQGMESSLGVQLFERTTRTVRLTTAGQFLFAESQGILGDVDATLQRLREDFADAPKQVRVGVSNTIGLAYLPGFFFSNQKAFPKVNCRTLQQSSSAIIDALEANELDIGVVSRPTRLPHTLKITHRFTDAFTLITSRDAAEGTLTFRNGKAFQAWAEKQRWLCLSDGSNTGRALRKWIDQKGWKIEPTMEHDSFDLIINLVALGMGTAFVPIRALALYGAKKSIQRISLSERFTRELVVLIRKKRKPSLHISQFVENILF